MKGIILGSDYLEKDDSVKILEINTNTTIFNDGAEMLDYGPLFSMLVQENINELHFIYTIGTSYLPTNAKIFVFEEKLKENCTANNIQYFSYTVPENSITVPYIEDGPNKFILRQSFDTTALIDETYCADKFEFLKLMDGSGMTPNSFFNDASLGVNSLLSLPQNGNGIPSAIQKPRNPTYDQSQYPIIYGFDSEEELQESKNSLPANEILQEFIYDESNLVDNKWSVIRGIDIIYGPNLDIINMGGYKQPTVIPIDYYESRFNEGTKIYDQRTRYKFINKQNGNFYDVTYHVDDESQILMSDGTIKNIDGVNLNDQVKSLDFTDLNGISASTQEQNLELWDGTFDKTIETLNNVDTLVNSKNSKEIKALFIRITLENGITWVDSPYSTFYFEEKDSISTRWDILNKIIVGDKLIVKNTNTGNLERLAVSSLSIEYMEQTVYELGVEPYDIFLSDIGDGIFTVMHNNCDCCGDPWGGYCGNWCCYPYCSFCGGGPPSKL